ncbi:MAG: hypothetical protein BWX86_02739 [Verrucomicrobia bacterium ADurb.Bin122]|nr:MAG: hypothetical protein BWX86_02739 [Verrucomicrobia bacterium ADurb.Bin122]
MCQPSASNASEPLHQPTAISTTIIPSVSQSTIRVRLSPFAEPRAKAWLWRRLISEVQ